MGSLNSCAYFEEIKKNQKEEPSAPLSADQNLYDLKDKSGEYELSRKTGFESKQSIYVTKYMVYDAKLKKNPLEKSVALSEVGALGKLSVLRPKVSQYSVWFEGKKFFSQMKVLPQERKVEIKLESPEPQYQGTYKIDIPKMEGLFCFYTQLLECVAATGFVEKAIAEQRGEAKLYVLWDNYPYFSEQYTDVPKEAITQASLSFDGKTDEGEMRFSFNFGEQNIYYLLDKKNKLKKVFWINQSYSLIRR
jgi:hypothetical protein